jgi:WD40 repeat protein
MKGFVKVLLLAVLVWQWAAEARLSVAARAADELQTFRPETGGGGVLALAYSPDGKTLASGGRGVTTLLDVDVATGKVSWDKNEKKRRLSIGDTRAINTLAFSPDGARLAAGGGNTREIGCDIYLWKAGLGGIWGVLIENLEKANRVPITCVAYHPDGKTLAAAGGDNTCRNQIKLWDVATFKKKAALTAHTDVMLCVAYSRDGEMLAAAGQPAGQRNEGNPSAIDLWNAATGTHRALLKGHTGAVYSVAFSPDGKTLASSASDETIKLWDLATLKERATLKANAGEVCAVVFSPDGKTLASAHEDATIKLWDAATGKEQAALKGHKDPVSCLAFSPDGKTLASGSRDNTIKLWRVSEDGRLRRVIPEEKNK